MSTATLTRSPASAAAHSRPLAASIAPAAWLGLGVIVTALVANRFQLAWLGWFAAVPWLVYLRQTDGWRSRLAFAGAVQLGMLLQIAKIITAPIPFFFAPLFSVPAALTTTVALILFEAARRRLGDRWGLVLFAALSAGVEYLGWAFTSGGSWGAAAYTQLDNLALLQTTALVGMSGIAVLTALSSAVTAVLLSSTTPTRWLREALALLALIAAAHLYGAWRMLAPAEGPYVTVAAVVTDIGLGAGGLPDQAALDAGTDTLFERTTAAAEAGAELVVWNEGATAIWPDHEEAFVARAQQLVEQTGIDLVLAYVVPLDGMAHYENKYRWLTPQGSLETYHKHFPVPGEGATPGTDPVVVHDRPYGKAAGAICYDYDFPTLGQQHARGGAGLVAVPSSDWAGIDPTHTLMARVRGIEGGFSVVRPVRWATSGAFDAWGRPLATLPYQDSQRIMMARVPTTPQPTLYGRIGDVLAWASIVGALLLFLAAFRRQPTLPAATSAAP